MLNSEESKTQSGEAKKHSSLQISDKTPIGTESSNELSNLGQAMNRAKKPRVSFSPIDTSPIKEKFLHQASMKRRQSIKKQSKKRKYIEMEDYLCQARYMLFYYDDIVQGGLHAKSELRYGCLQGEKEKAVLSELRLKEGIFFDFQVSPSQKKAKSRFSKLALAPFREDPFKDSSSYTCTPIKISSKAGSSLRSRTNERKRDSNFSPNFLKEDDSFSNAAASNGSEQPVADSGSLITPNKCQQITMPLQIKNNLLSSDNAIEEEVLIESDSISSEKEELKMKTQASGSSNAELANNMKAISSNLMANYESPDRQDIMKQKRLDEINKQTNKHIRRVERKGSLKNHDRYTINKDIWRQNHPEFVIKEKLSQDLRVKRKQTMGPQSKFKLGMKAVKEADDDSETSPPREHVAIDSQEKKQLNAISSKDDLSSSESNTPKKDLLHPIIEQKADQIKDFVQTDFKTIPCSQSILDELRESFKEDKRITVITDWWLQIKKLVLRYKPQLIPLDDPVHKPDQMSNIELFDETSKNKSASLSDSSMDGIGQETKLLEPTSADLPRRFSSASIEPRGLGYGRPVINHGIKSLQIDFIKAKNAHHDYSSIKERENSIGNDHSALSNKSQSGSDSSADSVISEELLALKRLTTLHKQKKCVGRRHQEMRAVLDPSLNYAHGDSKKKSSPLIDEDHEPRTPVEMLKKPKTFRELKYDTAYFARSKSFLGPQKLFDDTSNYRQDSQKQKKLKLKHQQTEGMPSMVDRVLMNTQESHKLSTLHKESLAAQKYDSLTINMKQRRKFIAKLKKASMSFMIPNDKPKPRLTAEEEEDLFYMRKQKRGMRYLKNIAEQLRSGIQPQDQIGMASETPDDATTFERPNKLLADIHQSDMQSQNPFKGSVKIVDSGGELTPQRGNTSGSILVGSNHPQSEHKEISQSASNHRHGGYSEQKAFRHSSNRHVTAFDNDDVIGPETRIHSQSTEVNNFLVQPKKKDKNPTTLHALGSRIRDSHNSSQDVINSKRCDTLQSLSIPEGPAMHYQLNVPNVDFSAFQSHSIQSSHKNSGKTSNSEKRPSPGKKPSDQVIQTSGRKVGLVPRQKISFRSEGLDSISNNEERKQMLNEPVFEWSNQSVAFTLEPEPVERQLENSPDFQTRINRRHNQPRLANQQEPIIEAHEEDDSKSATGDRSQDVMDVESKFRASQKKPQRRFSPPRRYLMPMLEFDQQDRIDQQHDQNSQRMLGSEVGRDDRLPDDFIIETSDSDEFQDIRRNLRSTNVSPTHSSAIDRKDIAMSQQFQISQLRHDLSQTLRMNKINNPLRAKSGKELSKLTGINNLHNKLAQTIKARNNLKFDFSVAHTSMANPETTPEEEKHPTVMSINSGHTNEAGLQPSISGAESEFSFNKRHSQKKQGSEKKFEVQLRRMDTFYPEPIHTNSSVDKRKEIESEEKHSMEKESLSQMKSGPAFTGDYFDGSPGSQRNKKQRSSIQLSLHLCEKSRGSSLQVNSERNKSPPPEMQPWESNAHDSNVQRSIDSLKLGQHLLKIAESPFQLATDQNSSIGPMNLTDSLSEVKSRQREEFNGSSLKNFRKLNESGSSIKVEEIKLNESLQRKAQELPPDVSKQTTFGTVLDGHSQAENQVFDRQMNRISLGVGLQPHKKISATILKVDQQQSLAQPRLNERFSILAKPMSNFDEDRSQRLGIVEKDLDQLSNMYSNLGKKKKKKTKKAAVVAPIMEEDESIYTSYFSEAKSRKSKSLKKTDNLQNLLKPPKMPEVVLSEGRNRSRSPVQYRKPSPKALSVYKKQSSSADKKSNLRRKDSMSSYSQSKKFGLSNFFEKTYLSGNRIQSPVNKVVRMSGFGSRKDQVESPVSMNFLNANQHMPIFELQNNTQTSAVQNSMLVGSQSIVNSATHTNERVSTTNIKPFQLNPPKERLIDINDIEVRDDCPFDEVETPRELRKVEVPLVEGKQPRHSMVSTYQQKTMRLGESIDKFRRRKDLKIEIAGSERPRPSQNLKNK